MRFVFLQSLRINRQIITLGNGRNIESRLIIQHFYGKNECVMCRYISVLKVALILSLNHPWNQSKLFVTRHISSIGYIELKCENEPLTPSLKKINLNKAYKYFGSFIFRLHQHLNEIGRYDFWNYVFQNSYFMSHFIFFYSMEFFDR